MTTVAIFPLILVKESLTLNGKGAYNEMALQKTGHKVLPVMCSEAPRWLHCGKNPLKFVTKIYVSIGNRANFGYNRSIYIDNQMSYVFPG